MKKLLLILYLIANGLYCLGIDLNFKFYKVEDGLSSNTVYDIIQDGKGYIWIGTEDGLNRFDGHEFRYYRNIPRDTASIVNNYVYTLLEDKDGEIWIGTEKGLCIYNPVFDTFRVFRVSTPDGTFITDRIQSLVLDDHDRLWIGSNRQGIFVYDKSGNALQKYDFDHCKSNERESIYVTCVYKDKKNTIWASVNNTRHQIYRLKKGMDHFEPAFPELDPGMPARLSSYSMLEDTFGFLWLATWNDGLFAFDTEHQLAGNYLSKEGVDKILHIHSMVEYEPGKFLIGSNEGLTSFIGNPVMGYKKEMHVRDPVLSDCFVYPIYRDKEGGLWIGTYYGGINYASANRNYFTGYIHNKYENSISGNVVSVFCEDPDGNLWIGTDDGGLNFFHTRTERFVTYKPEKGKNSLSFHNIHALCIDGDNLWIGTYTGGLNVLNLSTKRFTYHYSNPSDTSSISSNSIYSLFKDAADDIWIGTMSGIDKYDRQTGHFQRMMKHRATTFDIVQTGDLIWFATSGDGLFRYDLTKKSWKQYLFEPEKLSSLISNNVLCLCVDQKEQLWIGTNSGLCRYDVQTDSFILIDGGFESNTICNIFCDNELLWITTMRGLIEYDPKRNKHRSFTKEDGLTSEQFNVKSGIKTSSGRIYAGTTNGFNAFYPRQIVVNRTVPQVVITDFQLFNKSVSLRDYMQTTRNGAEQIRLSYHQNSFSFDFTALSYFAPEKNEYAFMLDGFDRDWNYIGKKRRATYTNIPPGEYYFKVRASNNDGIWNNEGISVKLVITPPFWLTKWFILIYIILGVSAVLGLYIYQKRRIERKNRAQIEKIKIEQEKEAYASKINFFTTIAHEIRTPVSLIIGPLEQIIHSAGQLPEKIKDDLNTINKNSQRLLSLVNQLLDFRKIEKGTLPMSFSEQNVHELLMNVYVRFKSYVENRNMKLTFTSQHESLIARVDAENLTKVVSNLLNNASKFAKDSIELLLLTDEDIHSFRIVVRDNGCGISREQQEHIFKPFYQVPGTKAGGTGLGLYLVQSIIDACKGTLEIESELGKGSSFVITLPIERTNERGAEQIHPVEFTIQAGVEDNTEEPHGLSKPDNLQEPVLTLLIVEDNVEMVEFLRKGFAENYRVLTAGNGKEGINILEKHEVDLIISDIMMPEMDGIEFCNQVKSNFLWNHIPLILLTAKTTVASKIEAMEKGADDYVDKPFSISYLYARVKNLLESRRKLMQKFAETPYSSLKSIAGNRMDEEFLVKVNDVIEQNISNVDFTMEQLAEELNISSSGLFAKIKSLSGMTPNKLLLLVRLKKAAELLQENRYRINEVCYRVGFNNPSYFAKCFQKQYGVLPKDFSQPVPENN